MIQTPQKRWNKIAIIGVGAILSALNLSPCLAMDSDSNISGATRLIESTLDGLRTGKFPEAAEQRLFTDSLRAVLDDFWGHGDPKEHSRSFDADVFYGGQQLPSGELKVTGMKIDNNTTLVFVRIPAADCDQAECKSDQSTRLRYTMRFAAGHWSVDDIIYSNGLSIKEYVRAVKYCESLFGPQETWDQKTVQSCVAGGF